MWYKRGINTHACIHIVCVVQASKERNLLCSSKKLKYDVINIYIKRLEYQIYIYIYKMQNILNTKVRDDVYLYTLFVKTILTTHTH